MYQKYRDRGLIIVSFMAETSSGSVPTSGDLAEWADEYGLTFPVLADVGWGAFDTLWPEAGTPRQALIAPGMKLVSNSWVGEWQIEEVLPQ